jgi:hypothetical protein
MKKQLALTMAAGLVLIAGQAQAKHYGAAGCGLGSQLFKNNDKTSQVLGGTTNGTSGNQTFGITSGTSNCTDDGTHTAQGQVPLFIETNQVALANDIARGSGETLASLSQILGCDDVKRLGATLQKDYGRIFTTQNIKDANVTDSILDSVKGDSTLALECLHLI